MRQRNDVVAGSPVDAIDYPGERRCGVRDKGDIVRLSPDEFGGLGADGIRIRIPVQKV